MIHSIHASPRLERSNTTSFDHKQENNILKQNLEFFEQLKNRKRIKTEETINNIPPPQPLASNWTTQSKIGKFLVKVLPWGTLCASLLDTTDKIIQLVSSKITDCQPPWWSVASSIAVSGIVGAWAVTNKYCSSIERENAKQAQEKHAKELEKRCFDQFTAAFDNYKWQVEANRRLKEGSSKYPVSIPHPKSNVDSNICLECFKKCSDKYQNKYYTREMWISQIIYLSKKEQTNKSPIISEDDMKLTKRNSKRLSHSLSDLISAAYDGAIALTIKHSISENQNQLPKNYAGETANEPYMNTPSERVSATLNFEATPSDEKQNVFIKQWQEIEEACGFHLDYLAVENVFIGRNGKIYENEVDAIQECRDKIQVAINI